MKKSFLATIVVLLSMTVHAYDFHVGDFYYNILPDEKNAVEIVPVESDSVYAHLRVAAIPETVTFNDVTYQVVSIGDTAFSYCTRLQEVNIPESVTRIGRHAFNHCVGLSHVTIPKKVRFIGENVFMYCTSLKSVKWNAIECATPLSEEGFPYPAFYGSYNIESFQFGDSVQVITAGICYDMTKVKTITLPQSVTRIEARAFSNCNSLKKIKLPENLQYIGNQSFDGDSSLSAITIPETVTFIDKNAFYNCINLRSVTWNAVDCSLYREGNTYCPIFYNDSNISSFTFGRFVRSIPIGLCGSLSKLKEVRLPSGLEKIGDWAFSGCKQLESIVIPQNVREIGKNVFSNCTGLTSVIWNAKESSIPFEKKSYGPEYHPVFANDSNITSFTFGDSVKVIPMGLCNKLQKIESIQLPPMLKTIGYQAFYKTNFPEIILPDSLTEIEGRAFEGNKQLTTIVFPDSMDIIGNDAFMNCKSLKEVSLPKIGEYIGGDVFAYCDNLTHVIWNTEEYIAMDFIHVFGKYSSLQKITFGKDVRVIPAHICNNLSKLETVLFLGEVKKISDKAFEGCSSLSSIELPRSLEYIGENAFYKSGLTSITIPVKCKHIGFEAFADTRITKIAWNAMALDNNEELLKTFDYEYGGPIFAYDIEEREGVSFSISFGDSVLSLPDYLCGGMKLKDISFSNSIVEVRTAFAYCQSQVPIYNANVFAYLPRDFSGVYTIPDGISSIADGAFIECKNLKGVQIPNTVKNIGRNAFSETGIQSVHIPQSVSHIALGAFEHCSELAEIMVDERNPVYDSREKCNAIISTKDNVLITGCQNSHVPLTVTEIGNSAFAGCKGLKNIKLHDNIHRIDSYAFFSSGLKSIYIGANITQIENNAFLRCFDLSKIIVKNNKYYTSGSQNKYLVDITDGILIKACNTNRIPKNIRIIEDGAFAYSNIRSIVLPESVIRIGYESFQNCTKLKSVKLNNNLQDIYSRAFSGCEKIKEIRIPSSVYEIGSGAFEDCTSLRKCYVESNLDISPSWFYGCEDVKVTAADGRIVHITPHNVITITPAEE